MIAGTFHYLGSELPLLPAMQTLWFLEEVGACGKIFQPPPVTAKGFFGDRIPPPAEGLR